MLAVRGGIGIGGALVLAVLLSACTAPTTPESSPTSSAPTTESTSSELAAPTFRLPLGCDDLVSTTDAAEALRAPATLVTWPSTADHASLDDIAVTAAGGLVCQWTVEPDNFSPTITTETYPAPRMVVQVLPDAASTWNPGWQDDAEATDTRDFGTTKAFASCGDIGCRANALVGSNWVQILIYNPGAQLTTTSLGSPDETFAHATPAFTSLFDRLASAGEPAPAWTPPTSAKPVASSCDALLPTDAAATALGGDNGDAGDGYVAQEPQKLPSVQTVAVQDIGALGCVYGPVGTSAVIAPLTITAVPGGAWIAPKILSNIPTGSTQAAVQLTGLPSSDTAILWCGVNDQQCQVLFSLNGQGIDVTTNALQDSPVSAHDAAIAAAEAIIARP
ncbi:hypothetical protein ACL9RL_03275 [Plantibacter sp. Mn2098]|uniref:hypothetical protein n=1 Tax=Plantibacter sp. Mn2098 TaxID=3395266 RepID=UPI003BC8AD20